MDLKNEKLYDIYNAKWYHFVYVWIYNLFHKDKKKCTKKSWIQSIILDNFEKGFSYPYIKMEMDDLKNALKEFDINFNESDEGDENVKK